MTYATHNRIGDLLRLVTLVGVAITASAVSAGVNTWTTSGPGEGTIRELAIDPVNPATLYAAASGAGLFKTINGGGSWRTVNNGLTNGDIGDLVIDPSDPEKLYVSTSEGVFKSINGEQDRRPYANKVH